MPFRIALSRACSGALSSALSSVLSSVRSRALSSAWPKVRRWRQLAAVLPGLLAAGAGGAGNGAVPAACMHASPSYRVALVELYTSEGCDSCPSADRWLGVQAARLPAGQAVSLALHVDYWDGLGWRDRFGSPVFGTRQRRLAAAAGGGTIYTPEVFIGAREQRDWRDATAVAARIAVINALPAGAALQLGWQAAGPERMDVALHVRPAPGSAPLRAYVVLVEDGLVSAVAAGENRGATLHHERVARLWVGPLAVPPAGLDWEATVPLPAGADARHLSWLAFAQPADGEIAQALAAPACAPARP